MIMFLMFGLQLEFLRPVDRILAISPSHTMDRHLALALDQAVRDSLDLYESLQLGLQVNAHHQAARLRCYMQCAHAACCR